MASITKAELVQINSRLASDNDALRAQVAQLQGDVARLTEQLAQGSEIVEALSRPSQRVARHMPMWQIERAAAMQHARAQAMQFGVVVKV